MSELLSYFEVNWRDLIPIGIKIIVILLVIIIASRVMNRLFKRAMLRADELGRDTGYIKYFRYVVLAVIYFLGFASIVLALPGLDDFVRTLLAGSGILAVIIGIASQQAAGNLVSGALILVFRPFKVGDYVNYLAANKSGTIEEIGFRHTVIKTADNHRLIIPNSLMNSNVVENADSGGDEIYFALDISVSNDSDTRLAMDILGEIIANQNYFIDKRTNEQIRQGQSPATVTLRELSGTATAIRAAVWAQREAYSTSTKSDLLLEIKSRFDQNGIRLA